MTHDAWVVWLVLLVLVVVGADAAGARSSFLRLGGSIW